MGVLGAFSSVQDPSGGQKGEKSRPKSVKNAKCFIFGDPFWRQFTLLFGNVVDCSVFWKLSSRRGESSILRVRGTQDVQKRQLGKRFEIQVAISGG